MGRHWPNPPNNCPDTVCQCIGRPTCNDENNHRILTSDAYSLYYSALQYCFAPAQENHTSIEIGKENCK
ncbi:hypothetical protein GJ496_010987 [Pomphorhynchus laevis]|nr:hypothetical protein GJ496_010987 [Pomphorhynchus laevis]